MINKKSIYFFISSLLVLLIACKSEKKELDLKPVKPFIQGLTYISETTTRTADTSFKYKPHFPDTILAPYEFEYLIDLDLCYEKAYYNIEEDIITGYLPIRIDYDFNHQLLLGEKNDNDLIFGEYDFNNDNINEIVIGVKDNNGDKLGLQLNIIRYIVPPKTETVFCDYWLEMKYIYIKDIRPDTYVKIEDNKIIILNTKKDIEPILIDKAVFDKAVIEE